MYLSDNGHTKPDISLNHDFFEKPEKNQTSNKRTDVQGTSIHQVMLSPTAKRLIKIKRGLAENLPASEEM
jgi:hypothetical protein